MCFNAQEHKEHYTYLTGGQMIQAESLLLYIPQVLDLEGRFLSIAKEEEPLKAIPSICFKDEDGDCFWQARWVGMPNPGRFDRDCQE